MITLRQPFTGEYPISLNYKETFEGIYTESNPHTGIDYACPTGTPILAAAEGTVYLVGYSANGYGRYCILRHADNVSTLYAHMNTIRVAKGQKIASGGLLGYSGNTGASTGPHLHFECRKYPNDSRSHFDPNSLMQCVDDSITADKKDEILTEGFYEANVTCWVRDINMNRICFIQPGTRVYVFNNSKIHDGLRFYEIGADLFIAGQDAEGTVLLKKMEE